MSGGIAFGELNEEQVFDFQVRQKDFPPDSFHSQIQF